MFVPADFWTAVQVLPDFYWYIADDVRSPLGYFFKPISPVLVDVVVSWEHRGAQLVLNIKIRQT